MKIKIYREVIHTIMSVIYKQNLDDVPKTTLMMRTRVNQLRSLLAIWQAMTPNELTETLLDIRLELTVKTEKIIDGRHLCSKLDALTLSSIQRALKGAFRVYSTPLNTFIEDFKLKFTLLLQLVHGSNEYAPTICMRNALTYARQATGWSGKNMEDQLREAQAWTNAAAVLYYERASTRGGHSHYIWVTHVRR